MSKNKRIVLAITIIAFFIFVVFTALVTVPFNSENTPLAALFHPFISYHVEFMILAIALALAVGAGVYYLMAERIDTTQAGAKKCSELLLKFLDEEERLVINYLLKHDGRALQAELARLPDFNRLKAHRLVNRLKERGIFVVEAVGKARVITLAKELKDIID